MKFTGFAFLGLMGCAFALPQGPPQPDSAPAGPRLTGLPFPIPSGIPTSLPSGLPGFGGFGGIAHRNFFRHGGSAPSGFTSSRPPPSRTPVGFPQPSGSFDSSRL